MNNQKNINSKIGILGLGVLGSAIAHCFIQKQIKIYGYDISNKFYKKLNKNYYVPIKNLDNFYSKCDVVITCLPTEESLINVTKSIKSNL